MSMILIVQIVVNVISNLGAIHPQWISVNNAVYVCYNCSGVHRGFGVQISFVRSLSMDGLSDQQKKLLSLGGNKRFMEFMEMYELGSEPANIKYKTRAAEFYRGMIKAMAEGKTYSEVMPELADGKMIIKGFEDIGSKPTSGNFEQFGNSKDLHEGDYESNGFFGKIVNTAKGFGNMTKNAAGTAWEKSKSITVILFIS